MNCQSICKLVLIVATTILAVDSAQAQYSAEKSFAFLQETFNQHDKRLHDFLIEELDHFTVTFPNSEYTPEATFLLAKVYEEKGEKHEALALYFKTVFLYPDSTRQRECTDLVKPIAENERVYKDKQEILLNTIQGEFPINTAADRYYAYLNFLNELNVKNLHKRTLAEAKRFISLFPDDSRTDVVLQWIADVYAKMGKELEASTSYLKLESICPDSPLLPHAHYNRGMLLYQEMGNHEDAVSVFNKLVSDYPENEYASESLFILGEIKEKKLKDYQGAIVEYRKLVDTYPEHKKAVQALLTISEINSKNLKNYTAAVAAYEEIVEKYQANPLGVKALEEIGNIYENRLKDFTTAANYYAKIAELYPAYDKAPDMLLKAGSVCEDELQNYEKAIEYYQLIVDKYPDHKRAGDAKKRIAKARGK